MRTAKIPTWVPDWKDNAAYAASYEDWSTKKWVWAFLRRNPEYQADYEHFSALPTYYPGGGKTSKLAGRSACSDDDMALRYCDPPALPGETWYQYWERLGDSVIAEMPLEEHLTDKWCITNLRDPADNEGYHLIFPSIESPPYLLQIRGLFEPGGYFVRPAYKPDELEHLTLRFDLRFNIDKQLEIAKLQLTERLEALERESVEHGFKFERVRAKGHQLENLPKYLRAFDATWTGAGIYEVAEKLFPKKSTSDSQLGAARRAVKAGKDLVNGGYKDLIRFK